ncbi:HNH endonuclease [Vibrio coralliilyticus]|uniref:HNH endonuclease n=1 Tax=Vibrio coralliilyticus TaxID=190893 RepID=UPI00148BC6C2|nr:HNH endonuclease [Vibrio coralliilyticus]NOI27848.1 HNH endonuclease [Vibrio coralliilyticus]NOI50810.1 HNH endonuclease [Vibrio coralliilyticus]
MAKRKDWSEQELSETVDTYFKMLYNDQNDIPYVKSILFQNLADKFGRTPKAFGRRMSNITHIMMLMDLPVVSGLGRLPNVGIKQAPIIERLISNRLKQPYIGVGLIDAETQSLVKAKTPPTKPEGDTSPITIETTTTIYKRSGKIKGWVIRRADGSCELCDDDAPFEKEDGTPFLEVHHLTRLKDGGSDTVENCAALCPNCHRKLHHSSDRDMLTEELREKVLEKESGL